MDGVKSITVGVTRITIVMIRKVGLKMTNKLLEVLLENTGNLIEDAHAKMQTLETEMKGAKGSEKKEALDNYLKEKVSEIIKNWNIKNVPDIIEDNYLDPATIALINNYIPSISQPVYDVAIKGIEKVNDELEELEEKLEN